MSKFRKSFIILAIMLIIFAPLTSLAVDMNITENNTSNLTNTTNNVNTSTNSNTTNTAIDDDFEDTDTATPYSTTINSADNSSNSELGLIEILNIMLIVIGTLLILLAIAILIRLKK